jgi:hypothetical protein
MDGKRGNSAFRPLRYKCPICGRRGRFGEHRCEAKADAPLPRAGTGPDISSAIKYGLSAVVALVLIAAFLWEMIGAASLYCLALAPAGVLAYRIIRKTRSSGGDDFRSLLQMANGDKEAAERLVAMEGMRHPGKPRKELIRNLVLRWRRELR